MPGGIVSPLDLVRSRVYAYLGVTCYLHFWQNGRGLLRATAVTRGWNGHWIRVSTQSWLWRRKFSRPSCRDSNSQPFDHEPGALTNLVDTATVWLPSAMYLTVLCGSLWVPAGSPSGGGDVTVHVWQNPAELAHSFLFCSCLCFCIYGPFNCISFQKFSRQLSAFPLCSSGLISALLVLSTIYHFMKVSLSPDIIPSGWLGSKHQLTKSSLW